MILNKLKNSKVVIVSVLSHLFLLKTVIPSTHFCQIFENFFETTGREIFISMSRMVETIIVQNMTITIIYEKSLL